MFTAYYRWWDHHVWLWWCLIGAVVILTLLARRLK